MTDIQRYDINDEPDGCDIREHSDGEYVKWADVSARLQQLEAENVRLLRALKAMEISQHHLAASADEGHQIDCAETKNEGEQNDEH